MLTEKSETFQNIIKIGRTHWMDATPITLGQEFSGYIAQLTYGLQRIEQVLPRLSELALGGTAVGTGLNAPAGFAEKAIHYINHFTGHTFIPAYNRFEAIASHDSVVDAHAALKQVAVSIMKISNDLRFLASGPRVGINEIFIPANEPGSSIMPGKINPTQIEAITMVCAQIIGNDETLTIGGMGGHCELNVYKPVIISNFLESAQLLGDACTSFANNCIKDIKANEKKINEYLHNSLMLITMLTPHIGYEKASHIAQKAYTEDKSLEEAAVESGYLTREEFQQWVRFNRI